MIRNTSKFSKDIIICKVGRVNNSDDDVIYLIGVKVEEGKNTLYRDLEIVISSGSNGELINIKLNNVKGYNPKIILSKFISSENYQILFTFEEEIEREGRRAIVYRLYNGRIETIFDSSEYLANRVYKVIYNDNYKVTLIDMKKNIEYCINIENKEYKYLKEKYDSNGKLIKPFNGEVLSAYNIFEIRSSNREVYDLLLKQKVVGESINDLIGEVDSTIRFDENNFDEIDIKVLIEKSKNVRMNFGKEDFIYKKYDFSKIDFVEAEDNANFRIERAIEKEFSLNHDFDKLNYLYNRIKLNNTNKNQVIVYLEGPKFCSERGGTVIILEEKNNDYIVTSKIKDVFPPIIVSNNMSNGYNDLIIRLNRKDKSDFRILKYNGNSYPMNPFEEEKLQVGSKVMGVSVISDDLFYRRGIEY